MTDKSRIHAAISLAIKYGGIDGAHHKDWLIDQMVRVLAGKKYAAIVAAAKDGDDGRRHREAVQMAGAAVILHLAAVACACVLVGLAVKERREM